MVQVVVPLVAAGILGASLAPRNRLAASGLLAVVLCKSDVYVQSLALYNPSLLFVLPLVVIGLLWSRGKWVSGAVILGLSIAVKPLLVLLVLIPLFRRDYRTALVAVSAAVVPNARHAAIHPRHSWPARATGDRSSAGPNCTASGRPPMCRCSPSAYPPGLGTRHLDCSGRAAGRPSVRWSGGPEPGR